MDDQLPPLRPDTDNAEPMFPLYRAPLDLPAGRCTTCDRDRPHCSAVTHLLARCPSCSATRAYNGDQAGEATRCDSCDQLAEWPEPWPRETDEIRVCSDCLRAGRAGVGHSTELGLVWPPTAIRGMIKAEGGDEPKADKLGFKTSVLETFDDGSYSLGIHVPQALVDQLMRTPRHPALQREYWPFHCGGWMNYVGKWEPQDFDRLAPGRGREWLTRHVDDPHMAEDYWDWLESDAAWSCVYACPRCGLHKVYVDAD